MEKDLISELIERAIEAREYAYCPYSHYAVGAALLTAKGKVYTGCNIENGSFSPTNCAERTAFFKAVSEGEKHFAAIAVVSGPEDGELVYPSPCGTCRQVMTEFCDLKDFSIILAKSLDDYAIYRLGELLPLSFNLNEDMGEVI